MMERFEKAAVLGDGAWGTALAMVLCANGVETTLWGPFPENIKTIHETNCNPFLKGVRLPGELKAEADLEKAVKDTPLLILAAPSQYQRGTLEKLKPFYDPEKHSLCNIAKGIEVDTLLRMSGVAKDVLGTIPRYAALSGPSHAEEVSRGVPTAVTVASRDPLLAERIQKTFMNNSFRIYTAGDLTGVELGGALKNVYAIAAGILDGMKLGDNPKAALMTRAIAEMTRLGLALGGEAQTFTGLSGIGDLIVTCMSVHSRNHFVGEELGKGRKIEEILASMGGAVAEGVKTSSSCRALGRVIGVEIPLVETIYSILYEGKTPQEALGELMSRKAKSEEEFSFIPFRER